MIVINKILIRKMMNVLSTQRKRGPEGSPRACRCVNARRAIAYGELVPISSCPGSDPGIHAVQADKARELKHRTFMTGAVAVAGAWMAGSRPGHDGIEGGLPYGLPLG